MPGIRILLATGTTALGLGAAIAGPHALPAQLAASGSTTTTATTAAGSASGSSTALRPRCDDGAWRGPDGIGVEGRPAGLDPGDRGAAYVWHDGDGWHLRTTDATNTAHHYSGTIAVSPGARVVDVRRLRLESNDHVWVDDHQVLHYDFTTYRGTDGFDFRVTACDHSREHESLRFSMDYDGHEDDPARIDLGAQKQHPRSATFTVTRSV